MTVAQVAVNDTFVDLVGAADPIGRLESQTITLDYPWITGQPYLVSMLTSTGLVIEHEIPAAVATPVPGVAFFGLMALLGTYVGVIPVLLGMLLLPVMRGRRRQGSQIRAGRHGRSARLFDLRRHERGGVQAGSSSSGAFGGGTLVVLGAAIAFLTLTCIDRYLRGRRPAGTTGASELRLALMISIGIGLHNLGEGLAIGSAYAVGELALGAFLVIGFTLHNTTEGLAIIAPLARRRTPPVDLVGGVGIDRGCAGNSRCCYRGGGRRQP